MHGRNFAASSRQCRGRGARPIPQIRIVHPALTSFEDNASAPSIPVPPLRSEKKEPIEYCVDEVGYGAGIERLHRDRIEGSDSGINN